MTHPEQYAVLKALSDLKETVLANNDDPMELLDQSLALVGIVMDLKDKHDGVQRDKHKESNINHS